MPARPEIDEDIAIAARALLRVSQELRRIGERPGDSDAVRIVQIALAFLQGSETWIWVPELLPGPKQLAEAMRTLSGGKRAHAEALIRMIDRSVDRARAGKNAPGDPNCPDPWLSAARWLAQATSSPLNERFLATLAERLAAHHVPGKSGRLPKGKWTSAKIAESLTGDRNAKTYASLAKKRRK